MPTLLTEAQKIQLVEHLVLSSFTTSAGHWIIIWKDESNELLKALIAELHAEGFPVTNRATLIQALKEAGYVRISSNPETEMYHLS
jgi:hypothetical protein